MSEKFVLGMMLGLIAGAIIMHTSPKAQELMEKSKAELIDKIEKI